MPCCQVMLPISVSSVNTINLPGHEEIYGKFDDLNEVPEEEIIFHSDLALDGQRVEAYLSSDKFYWTIVCLHPTFQKRST